MRGRTPILTAFVIMLVVVVWLWPSGRRNVVLARSAVYALARERGRADYVQSLADWQQRASAHFVLRFQQPDADVARLILATAEEHYARVATDLGYVPDEPTVIAVYPSRESLQQSFGWPASQSAVGVYWSGAIRILSPHAWIDANDPQEIADLFQSAGPFVHEFAHLVLDYRTGGNYPRWFTEGLAQLEEYRVTGYIWDDPEGDLEGLARADMYSIHELTSHFDSLDNQSLAYRESLSLVTYLARDGKRLTSLIEALGAHYPFADAVQRVYGVSMDQLVTDWSLWEAHNPNPWK